MDFGVVFPQTEIGPDPEDAKELIQASEQMGFEGLVVYDHVVGADTSTSTRTAESTSFTI